MAAVSDIKRRTTFAATRTPYVTRQDRAVRAAFSTGRYPDPDFAISQDIDFWEKVEGNATIRSTRDYRRHLVAGPRVTLEATTSMQKPLLPYADALLKRIKGFSTTRLGLADAAFRGMVVGRMHGHSEPLDLLGDGTKSNWFVLDRIKVQPKGRWEMKRVVDDGRPRWKWAIWDFESSNWVLPERPDWYVHHRYNAQEDALYGRDMGRVLYYLAHAEHVLWEAGLDTAERFGAPWILGKIKADLGGSGPGTGDDIKSFASLATGVRDVLQKLRAHNIMVGDERLMDVELLEAGLRGQDLIDRLIDKIQQSIRILILGSNLPTSATTGGSFALAEIQDESTRRLVRYDRELLGETLTEQVLERVLRWNRPQLSKIPHPEAKGLTLADVGTPLVRITDDEVDDPQQRQFRMQFAQFVPLPFRSDELYALGGFTPPGEDDETVQIAGAQPAGGLFGDTKNSPAWLSYATGEM